MNLTQFYKLSSDESRKNRKANEKAVGSAVVGSLVGRQGAEVTKSYLEKHLNKLPKSKPVLEAGLAVGGALGGYNAAKKYLAMKHRKEPLTSDEKKKLVAHAAVGSSLLGPAGSIILSKDVPKKRLLQKAPSALKRKILGAAIGIPAGAAIGSAIYKHKLNKRYRELSA